MSQTAIVTGATRGIGRWTALGLARAGYEVVLVGRDPGRLAETAQWIAAQARVSPPATEQADFASLRAVRDAAMRLHQRHARVALLVNNAGGAWVRRETSADGYEMTFAVNHLAPFLLTRLLQPAIIAAAPARIVTVASTAHRGAQLDFADLMSARGYGAMRAYGRSKLANILFTAELARRLADTGVVANAVHPGVVGSNFGAKGGLLGLGWKLLAPFLLTPEQGARESLRTALDADRGDVSGRYFSGGREVRVDPRAEDPAAAARLWAASDALVDRALA